MREPLRPRLTPAVIIKEAIVILANFWLDKGREPVLISEEDKLTIADLRQVYVQFEVLVDDLRLSIESFACKYLIPAMRVLADNLTLDAKFFLGYLPIERNSLFACNEHYHGISLRMLGELNKTTTKIIIRFDLQVAKLQPTKSEPYLRETAT